jgi:hypothetical protein
MPREPTCCAGPVAVFNPERLPAHEVLVVRAAQSPTVQLPLRSCATTRVLSITKVHGEDLPVSELLHVSMGGGGTLLPGSDPERRAKRGGGSRWDRAPARHYARRRSWGGRYAVIFRSRQLATKSAPWRFSRTLPALSRRVVYGPGPGTTASGRRPANSRIVCAEKPLVSEAPKLVGQRCQCQREPSRRQRLANSPLLSTTLLGLDLREGVPNVLRDGSATVCFNWRLSWIS